MKNIMKFVFMLGCSMLLASCAEKTENRIDFDPFTRETVSETIVSSVFLNGDEEHITSTVEKMEQEEEGDQVSMGVKKVTDREIEIKLSNHTPETIIYGDDYKMERYDQGIWSMVKPLADNIQFHAIAYEVKPEQDSFWSVDYTIIYGTLPAGEYRIVKNVFSNIEETYAVTGIFTISE